MYDYMRALEERFNSKPSYEQRQQLIAWRQKVSALLDKQGKKRLLRLVDAHTLAKEEMALTSFIAGFRSGLGNRNGTQYRQQLFLRSGTGRPLPGRS